MRTIERHEVTESSNQDISCAINELKEGDNRAFNAIIHHPNPTTAALLKGRPLLHRKEAGINSLVDSASYIFSVMGRLKQTRHVPNLTVLQTELIHEIEVFKETVTSNFSQTEYLSEYVPLSSYTLCMTLDDIISSTIWGGQGAWDSYSLVRHFNDSPLTGENFLIILERLILDTEVYIDVIEFFYICLNLGFRCRGSVEFSHEQIERIANSLYKRIRNHHGSTSKVLAPFPFRTIKESPSRNKPMKIYVTVVLILSGLFAAFSIGSYLTYLGVKQALPSMQTELL